MFGIGNKKEGDKTYNYDNRQDNSTSIVEGDLSDGAIRSDGGAITITDGGAFDLVETTTKNVLSLGSDALGSMGDLSESAFNLSERVTGQALDYGEASQAEAYDFASMALGETSALSKHALGMVADNSAEVFNAISENNRRTYDVIEGLTNDGAQVAQNSKVMVMALVAVAVAGLWMVKK